MKGLEVDEQFEQQELGRLVEEALERSGIGKARARELLEAGAALASGHYGVVGTWPLATTQEREAAVLGRLVARVAREFGLSIASDYGLSVKKAVAEALTK